MAWFSSKRKADVEGSDGELVSSFRATGDNRYLGELYKRYGHLVLGLCIKYLHNRMEAEDAVMQIFARLMNDLRKHEVTHFRSWLFVYSKNFCLMELRKRQTALKRDIQYTAEEMPLLMDSGHDPHLNEREEQVMLLEQAIDTLNEHQRTCIRLFYLEDRSYAEIARQKGYSVNEVKSHIQNGKRNLKIKLEEKNEREREKR